MPLAKDNYNNKLTANSFIKTCTNIIIAKINIINSLYLIFCCFNAFYFY